MAKASVKVLESCRIVSKVLEAVNTLHSKLTLLYSINQYNKNIDLYIAEVKN